MAEERVNRKLAAILAADVVGYSRLMGADEAGTLAALKQHRQTIFDPAVAAHNGRIVKLIGDGTIVEFGSVIDAVNCALSVQRSDDALPDEVLRQPKIVLRIGINLGEAANSCSGRKRTSKLSDKRSSYFKQALEHDPNYSVAYVCLGLPTCSITKTAGPRIPTARCRSPRNTPGRLSKRTRTNRWRDAYPHWRRRTKRISIACCTSKISVRSRS
jgi:Adenylate and Guanylate cyclase catalytic domain